MLPPHSYSSSERSIIQHTLRAHSCHRNPSAVMIQRQRRHWVKSAINSSSGSPGLLVESSRISLWNAVSFILASGLRIGISPTTISVSVHETNDRLENYPLLGNTCARTSDMSLTRRGASAPSSVDTSYSIQWTYLETSRLPLSLERSINTVELFWGADMW